MFLPHITYAPRSDERGCQRHVGLALGQVLNEMTGEGGVGREGIEDVLISSQVSSEPSITTTTTPSPHPSQDALVHSQGRLSSHALLCVDTGK